MDVMNGAYRYVITDIADPRVSNWPLMSRPWGFIGIIVLYLFSIYIFLPSYMANRKPYNLKNIILLYNVYQVLACILLIYLVATSGWTTHYTLGCELVDFSEDKLAVRMVNATWWHMLLKMSEFIETFFFVLRKKQNQISALHVYHHVSTFFISWTCCKYFGGGMATLTILVNSSVHILMYTYYLLAASSPEMQVKIQSLKPKVTLIQIVQLVGLFIHTMQLFLPSCKFPFVIAIMYLPNLALNILLFIKFYIINYRKDKKN